MCPAGLSTNVRTGNTTRGGSRRPSHISRRSTAGTKRRCSQGRSPRSRNPWTAVTFRRTRLLRKDTAGRRRNSRSKISFEVRNGGHRRALPVLRMGRVRSGARRARQSVLSELRTSGGLQVRRRRIEASGTLEGVRDGPSDLPRGRGGRRDRRSDHTTDAPPSSRRLPRPHRGLRDPAGRERHELRPPDRAARGEDHIRGRRWTCLRTLSVGRGSAFVPPAWPYRSWTRSSEMRSKCRRSEETDPRSRPPAGSVRWAPERSSSTGETVGPPGSLRTASKRSPPSRFRSRIRRDAETCLTRRTSTPGSEAIPSPRRCVSRTPVRPCISGTVGIRTPGSQTSVGSSPRDSPGPRQIFTFTHPPLPSALITHAGDGEAMALASVHTRSSVPPGAWAMLGRTDLEASTCWDFPTQADGHPRAGDASFNGVTPARCAGNLVRRYSRPGELVVDPMAGSGTIGDVARTLGRRTISFDLVPRRRDVLRADARACPRPAEPPPPA